MFRSFLIKYAEIGVKGKNRCLFEEALAQQIRRVLRRCQGEFLVRRIRGRIYVDALTEYDYDQTLERLRTVCGISGICPMEQIEARDIDQLCDAAVSYFGRTYPDRHLTFKVETRRAQKNYPQDSMEVNARVGERLLQAFPELSVDVHHPQVRLSIEIREEISFYSMEIPGIGGMPVGTNGKALALLSGGIDSPVATYLIARRGVSMDAVYFHAPPYTSERAKQKVIDLAAQVSRFCGPMDLYVVNFTDIQMAIYEKCPHDELTIIMRRYMMRIAERIAGESQCLGLVTGESIGQVASQTLPSLAATNEVCQLPVFRPCIGMDKQEIVNLAEKIGTYETSILPYEDCCTIFVAKHPVTKPNRNVIRRHEENLQGCIEGLVARALETKEKIHVGEESDNRRVQVK